MTCGVCWRGWRKTCQGRCRGMENDMTKAAARGGDISGGLRERERVKKRHMGRDKWVRREKILIK